MAKPEHEWLALYRKGDVEALGKLVEHYRRPLFGFILKMTEGQKDAEDVFQEVWFRAIRRLDRYRDKSFLSWLFRIAHNLVIDRARKAKPMVELHRDPEHPMEDPVETRLPDPSLGPDTRVAGHDLGHRIAEAVRQLPPEQREVFVMRTEAELPFKEIAKIQGTSINTALARMQYALAKLKSMLRDDYEALMRA
jgi:RNA polymerase sigma-70 factor (ECF subfamily)